MLFQLGYCKVCMYLCMYIAYVYICIVYMYVYMYICINVCNLFEYIYISSYPLITLPFQNPFFVISCFSLFCFTIVNLYHNRDSEMREASILQYNQLLTFLIQECFNGGALHDRLIILKKKNIQKWCCTEKHHTANFDLTTLAIFSHKQHVFRSLSIAFSHLC